MALASDANLARGLQSLGKRIEKIEPVDIARLHAKAESFQERGEIFKGFGALKFRQAMSVVLIANGMRFC
jgi:hypothetical protein